MNRRAKVIATMGPACESEDVILSMVKAGLNVARFNMSHGTHESHKAHIDKIKELRAKLGISLPVLIDTKGPEIRIGTFADGKIFLNDGDRFVFTTKKVEGNQNQVYVDFKDLPNYVSSGTKILLNDGLLEMKVDSVSESEIYCKVVFGGELSNNKSINVPSVQIKLPYLSAQDKEDIGFAVRAGAEYIAISFVRNKKDVLSVKELLKRLGAQDIKIISKIECQAGIDNIDEIISESDGIMVARGDLGVEIPFEKIPQIQKEIISKCNKCGKLVITATQMLESMVENAKPTRAEISDVANAILDGSGAVMLSAETSVGKYPALVIETMSKIICEIEAGIEDNLDVNNFVALKGNITASLAFGAYALAHSSKAQAIITVTKTGTTAIEISRFRPQVQILGCTYSEKVFQQLGAVWGVIPVKQPEINNTETLLSHAREIAVRKKFIKKGDLVVQTAGSATGISGSNMLILNYVD